MRPRRGPSGTGSSLVSHPSQMAGGTAGAGRARPPLPGSPRGGMSSLSSAKPARTTSPGCGRSTSRSPARDRCTTTGQAPPMWTGSASTGTSSTADTFASVFAPTVAAVRKLTRKPVLISETAVGPVAGKAAKIPGLFAGIRRHRLLGLVWFDVRQHHGIYHQDWRLENSAPAIAAFRKAVAQTEPPAGTHQGKARPVSGPKNPKPGRTPQ